jgi:hypothetical protein
MDGARRGPSQAPTRPDKQALAGGSVIELPTLATFSTVVAEPRFIAGVGAAVLAGIVRGFSGFGSALIYVPLMAAIYDPKIATVSFVIADYLSASPYFVQAFRKCHWRDVLPAFLAAAITVPFGTMLQKTADPIALRWGMAAFVTLFVVLLAAGWRYHRKPNAVGAIGAGALSGIAGGATQMSGPPLILFWLSGPHPAPVVRFNLMACLALIGFTLVASYMIQDLFKAVPIALGLLLWPIYIVSVFLGAHLFGRTSDRGYRRIAYLIIGASAVFSLPLFDSWFR